MANTNRPFGLRPVRYLNGSPWTGAVRPYYAPSTYATALMIGDPVQLTGTSNTAEYFGFGPATLPEVNLATAGTTNDWLGAVVSVQQVTRDSTVYRPASTEAIVYVADDPNLIFQIQDDGTVALAATSVGLNAVFKAAAGSTVTGRSGWTLDAGGTTAPAATAGFQMNILALGRAIDNEVGIYAVWEVKNNQHTYGNAAAAGV